MATFWAYTNFVDEIRTNADLIEFGATIWIGSLVALVLFSVYFLRNEVIQVMFQGPSYLLDPWNYIDLIPPVIVLLIAIINFLGLDSYWEDSFKSVGSLLMWLKLLYFCRISRHYGYLIRIIVKVVYDMRTFLMVLLITISAVADSFISIMQSEEQIVHNSLGELIKNNFYRFLNNVYITY